MLTRPADWLWNFLLSFFAPRIANDIGPLILLIFFGMLVFGYGFVWLCIPETRGLSLEEVDEMYRARVAPWRSARWRPAAKPLHEHPASLDIREEKEEKGEADA